LLDNFGYNYNLLSADNKKLLKQSDHQDIYKLLALLKNLGIRVYEEAIAYINYEKILQTTVIRKYNNNYKYTYGRITLDCNVTNKFLKDKESCKIIVLYDEEADCLIIKKIIL